MALKALLLKKQISELKKNLDEREAKTSELEKREAELSKAIEETETEEQRDIVTSEIESFEAEKEENEKAKENLSAEIAELEEQLKAEENEQEAAVERPAEREREVEMENRELNVRDEVITREDVKTFLGEVRSAIKEKRAINNIGLTIPSVLLGILRENIENYSKLYKYVTTRRITGTGRLLISGPYDEAVWTECCANLNELALTFYDQEFDCYKVGGFYAICNASLEDSDLNLMNEIMVALGQAIGLALDKAILYGKNTSTNQKMPLGVVSRLVQTSAPAGYPATARPWENLSATNVLSVPAGTTGADLISAIVSAFGAAKGRYARGEKVWLMNEKTYSALGVATITTDSMGRIVTGVFERMPVIGGAIEVLNFIPDNVIVAGYFDLYWLLERAGEKFATSEHVKFLSDQTVMKGTARYDGAPVIAEAFVAIGLNGVTPTSDMTFAADTANQGA